MQVKAAQYVRMSSDQQSHSIAVQKEAIRIHAEQHGMDIVETYADEGKSGMTLSGRPAMQQLLLAATSRARQFNVVLVLDVSRWGRYQDPDESGYYEFLCRKNGLQVVYVSDPSDLPASPLTSLSKYLKRAAAAEYSRELGVKCRAGIVYAVKQGFPAGCMPCLGYRRQAVSAEGVVKGLLLPKERKPQLSDRVKWVLGPKEELEVVRKIFRDCIAGKSVLEIVRALNRNGQCGHEGKPMTEMRVHNLLRNRAVIGKFVWGGPDTKSKSATNIAPLPERIGNEHVPAIIDMKTWDEAHEKLLEARNRRFGFADDILLEMLRVALVKRPGLSGGHFGKNHLHNADTYRRRFGSLASAYDGADSLQSAKHSSLPRLFPPGQFLHQRLKKDILALLVSHGIAAELRSDTRLLYINGVRVDIRAARELPPSTSGQRWFIKSADLHKEPGSWLLLMRINADRCTGKDFFVLPPAVYASFSGTLNQTRLPAYEPFRLETAEALAEVLRAVLPARSPSSPILQGDEAAK